MSGVPDMPHEHVPTRTIVPALALAGRAPPSDAHRANRLVTPALQAAVSSRIPRPRGVLFAAPCPDPSGLGRPAKGFSAIEAPTRPTTWTVVIHGE